MRKKLIVVVTALLLLIGWVFTAYVKNRRTVQQEKPRSVRERVDGARATGQPEIIIPGEEINYGGSQIDLDAAVSSYESLIVELIEERSIFDGESRIVTWYKFRVIESLSDNKTICYTCGSNLNPPGDLLPINPDEVLLVKAGGTVVIDGVRVTMPADENFPNFRRNTKYLLFISKDPSGMANLPLGPAGVFRIDDDDSLEPIANTSHRLKADIEGRFSKSLAKFRKHVKSKAQ